VFIIDDLILAPAKGFMWLVRELHDAAERDIAATRDDAMRQLQSLHMKLEAGHITEDEFDQREAELLDLIETIDQRLENTTNDGQS
jgi:hypothetical protein